MPVVNATMRPHTEDASPRPLLPPLELDADADDGDGDGDGGGAGFAAADADAVASLLTTATSSATDGFDAKRLTPAGAGKERNETGALGSARDTVRVDSSATCRARATKRLICVIV